MGKSIINPNITSADIHPEIRLYCQYLAQSQKLVLSYNNKTKRDEWDLPAMASVCHDGNYGREAWGYSDDPGLVDWHPVMKAEIAKLGPIGKTPRPKRPGNRFALGRCAEQHAGNEFLKYYQGFGTGDLHFSEAVRPRTMEPFLPCDNCIEIFPNLK